MLTPGPPRGRVAGCLRWAAPWQPGCGGHTWDSGSDGVGERVRVPRVPSSFFSPRSPFIFHDLFCPLSSPCMNCARAPARVRAPSPSLPSPPCITVPHFVENCLVSIHVRSRPSLHLIHPSIHPSFNQSHPSIPSHPSISSPDWRRVPPLLPQRGQVRARRQGRVQGRVRGLQGARQVEDLVLQLLEFLRWELRGEKGRA